MGKLEIRKSVLGKEFVEKSIWGAVCGREGLPKKTRSVIKSRHAERTEPAV